tara:strand:- start:1626 stop:3455 length:1830 start_codon:yes stop_codon:yes gene_type:complete
MALPDLSGSLIQNTYQRVLHTDGAAIFDGTGSTVLSQTELASLQEIGSSNITNTEWAEIAAIGSANITATQWGYLANVTNVNWDNLATIEQNLGNTNTIQFAKMNASTTVENGDSPAFANASGRAGFAFQNITATSSMYILFNRNERPIEFRQGGHISMSAGITASNIKINISDELPLEFRKANGDVSSYVNYDGVFVGNVEGIASSATNAVNATNATNIVAGSNAEDEDQFITFLDNGDTGAQGIKYDGGIRYNPSKNRLTLTGGITGSDVSSSGDIEATAYYSRGQQIIDYSGAEIRIGNVPTNIPGNITASGDISASGDITAATFVGNIDAVDGDFDGTLEADAITIGGTSLSDVIAATVVDNATLAGSVTVTNSTADAETPVVFHNEVNGLRDDTGTFTYNAADGRLTVPDINSQNVTASVVSSSGNVYSTNTETIQYSFQLQNGADANTWYGPNSQGPNYYYWNRDYSAYPHTGIVYLNSGHHLQHKAELVSAKFILTGLTKPFTGAAVTASVVVKPKTDLSQAGGGFTYPLTSADNDNLFENGLSANFVNTMSVVYGMYEIQCPVSGAFDVGSILYPRIRLGAPYTGSGNFRGMWQLEYRRIK